MANMMNPDKEKIIYSEWVEVREELERIRQKMSDEGGGAEVPESEFLRILTLKAANASRKARGLPPLNVDPSASPFGKGKNPGGIAGKYRKG